MPPINSLQKDIFPAGRAFSFRATFLDDRCQRSGAASLGRPERDGRLERLYADGARKRILNLCTAHAAASSLSRNRPSDVWGLEGCCRLPSFFFPSGEEEEEEGEPCNHCYLLPCREGTSDVGASPQPSLEEEDTSCEDRTVVYPLLSFLVSLSLRSPLWLILTDGAPSVGPGNRRPFRDPERTPSRFALRVVFH